MIYTASISLYRPNILDNREQSVTRADSVSVLILCSSARSFVIFKIVNIFPKNERLR